MHGGSDPLQASVFVARYVADDQVEKAMNVRQAALSNEIKHFFSQGDGNAGADCDFYYVTFRPMEVDPTPPWPSCTPTPLLKGVRMGGQTRELSPPFLWDFWCFF